MSITKLSSSTEERNTDLSFDNGDRQALKDVIEQYGFQDEQSALRFALTILLKNEGEGVLIEENGNRVMLTPSEKLLKKVPEEGADTTSK